MTGRIVRGAESETSKERRAAAGQRVHFESMVAVGGAEGGFEAESVDLSADGMRLRTAYLPAVGEKLVCRFDGLEGEVVALGEVLWTTEASRGGEFAVRFVELDDETAHALKQLCDIEDEPEPKVEETKTVRGTRVKLHIEGLASPMKARVKEGSAGELRVGSSLEFLKLGRHVEVEDVDHQSRREGFVDGVRVEIDPSTSVPQLVVSLRFDGGAIVPLPATKREGERKAKAPAEPPARRAGDEEEVPATKIVSPSKATAAPVSGAADEEAAEDEEAQATAEAEAAPADEEEAVDLGRPADKLRAARARAAKVTTQVTSAVVPTLSRVSTGARDLFASLRGGLEKRRQSRREAAKANAPRRVTAPPPSGALKSDGKRVVRDDVAADAPLSEEIPKKSRRGLAIGAAAGLALVVGIYGVTKAGSDTPAASAPVAATDVRERPLTDVPPIPGAPAMAEVPLYGATPLTTTEAVIPPPPSGPKGAAVAEDEDAEEKAGDKNVVREWGSGQVSSPKVLKVRMDGPVQGFTATEVDGGFDLTVPGRKSLSTSTALVRKDKRISSLDVIPREDATEINVRFKGDAPAYIVKARSDRIEIALGGAKEEGDKVADKKKVAAKKKSDKKKKTAQ